MMIRAVRAAVLAAPKAKADLSRWSQVVKQAGIKVD
jgi:hypothetical protein